MTNRTLEEEKHLVSINKKITSLEDEIIHLMDKHPELYKGIFRLQPNNNKLLPSLNAARDSIRNY